MCYEQTKIVLYLIDLELFGPHPRVELYSACIKKYWNWFVCDLIASRNRKSKSFIPSRTAHHDLGGTWRQRMGKTHFYLSPSTVSAAFPLHSADGILFRLTYDRRPIDAPDGNYPRLIYGIETGTASALNLVRMVNSSKSM